MSTTYFKRFRMEIDFARHEPRLLPAPDGYYLLSWDDSLLEIHAKTKYRSFCDEIDAHVFPCFNELAGCRRLMHDIAGKPGFMPEATWLAVCRKAADEEDEYCGTIQGIRQSGGVGSIQNLGIIEGHRDRGLGTCLLYAALRGFRRAGLSRASLEVTAENEAAIRLYHRHGFEIVKTVYKAVEMVCS
jgi:ribosomal protein S18 acetylase RimI-like enzyme